MYFYYVYFIIKVYTIIASDFHRCRLNIFVLQRFSPVSRPILLAVLLLFLMADAQQKVFIPKETIDSLKTLAAVIDTTTKHVALVSKETRV